MFFLFIMRLKKDKNIRLTLYRWVITPKLFGFSRGVGRNNLGRITGFHRGGGHKRLFRKITWGFMGIRRCVGVYFDPNRRAFLSLIQPVVSSSLQVMPPLFWVLAPKGISNNAPFNLIRFFYSIKLNLAESLLFFSRKQLRYFVLQQEVHSISVVVGDFFGYFSRSAGCSAVISSFIKKGSRVAVLLLPSGKFCFLADTCVGSSGRVSNSSYYLKKLYKAGQKRWLGRRPIVRGVAINPVDHPHGGRTNGGRPSVSPWGKLTKVQNKKKLLFLVKRFEFIIHLCILLIHSWFSLLFEKRLCRSLVSLNVFDFFL
jgi:large subunit ribosomal protein L2